jgi:hypothetical protein
MASSSPYLQTKGEICQEVCSSDDDDNNNNSSSTSMHADNANGRIIIVVGEIEAWFNQVET